MQALAEFVMRNKRNATIVVALGMIIPFGAIISSAVASLVMLRYGIKEYLAVANIGCAIGLFWWFYNSSTVLWILLGSGLLSYVLRNYVRWQAVLVLSVLIGIVVATLIYFTQFKLLEFSVQILIGITENQINQALSSEQKEVLIFIALGLIAFIVQLSVILSVMLARYWQSCLYNKGGFGREFRSLIFSYKLALVLFFGIIIEWFFREFYGASQFASFILLIRVPLVLSALALVHHLVSIKRLHNSLLVVCYVCVFTKFNLLLCVVALLDSLVNIRGRFRSA